MTEEGAHLRGWVGHARCLAAAVLFAWPLFWCARSLVQALPALATAAFTPYTLATFAIRPDGLLARVFPPGAVTDEYRPGMGAALQDPFGISILLAAAAVLVLLALRRRLPISAQVLSLGAGYVAIATLESAFRSLWFRREQPDLLTYIAALTGLVLTVLALRAVASGSLATGRTARAILPILLLLAPYLALLSVFVRGGLRAPELAVGTSVAVLAILVSLLTNRPDHPRPAPGFATLGTGLVATLAVFALGSSFRALPPERALMQSPPAPSGSLDAPYPRLFFQRGVSFTSEWPDSYDSAHAHEMLKRLRSRGVDAIALVPYGTSRQGDSELRFGGWERDSSIVALTNTAHSLGMKVMLKPQVWVRGSYPGDLDFDTAAERDAWFAAYERMALHYARLAARTHADLFCVGTEFARLTRHEAYWRGLIAKVQEAYPGPLTYAANFGEEFETIPFWDDLDYIGLNNYYPLPDSLDVSSLVAKVETVQSRYGKPVLFTEGGYSSYRGGHRQPWAENEGPVDLEMQAAAYNAVLSAFWEKPWFYGAYWWKVGSNGFGGPLDRSHTPWGKPAMEVLRTWYARPPHSKDPAPSPASAAPPAR